MTAHIWVPKTKIIEPRDAIVFSPVGVSGSILSIVAVKPDGRRQELCGAFPNLVTNGGLEMWGTYSPFGYCSLGSSSQVPVNTDSGLVSYVAHTSAVVSTVHTFHAEEGATPAHWSMVRVYSFVAQGSSFNISEVGVGRSAGGVDLWSRSLSRDQEGNPVTVPWAMGDTIDVTYEVRKYPFAETTYSGDIGGITRTGIVRPSEVDTTLWEVNVGRQYYNRPANNVSSPTYSQVYEGAIGDAYASPSGAAANNSGAAEDAYDANSKKRTGSFIYGPSVGNFAAGITSFRHVNTVGVYQMQFSPAIMKAADKTLTLYVATPTWGRV